jgi:hypothetical protein
MSGMTIKLNTLLLILGTLFFGAGLILGLAPMSQSGYDCGSAFSPNGYNGAAQCKDALSGWRGVSLALIIPGALLALSGGVVTISDKEKADDVLESEEAPTL